MSLKIGNLALLIKAVNPLNLLEVVGFGGHGVYIHCSVGFNSNHTDISDSIPWSCPPSWLLPLEDVDELCGEKLKEVECAY